MKEFNRVFRNYMLIGGLGILTSCARSAENEERPNVIIIMTDDQGYGDFGFTGNPLIRTPNLDQMAAESAQMNTFYVCPVCSPTRASLLTGQIQLSHPRCGYMDWPFHDGSRMK